MGSPFVSWTVERDGASKGPLRGLTFAAKDNFDVEGERTSAGNPDYLETHPPAERTAPVIQACLDAGANLVGKTITDELASSLIGINEHYGTPDNPAAPGRIPGGSSSGSASAVALGLVDFSIGTDTGGSVRVPASHCGLWGIRTTHDAISREGLVPLAPSLDSVGFFARDPKILSKLLEVLLPDQEIHPIKRAYFVRDAFDQIDAKCRKPLYDAISIPFEEINLYDDDFSEVYQAIQGWEHMQANGAWIEATKPRFGTLIQMAIDKMQKSTAEKYEWALQRRAEVTKRLLGILDHETVLITPSAVGVPPTVDTSPEELIEFRSRGLVLGCLAGFAGLPQLSMPLATVDELPIGLSYIGGRNADRSLLQNVI